MKKHYFLGLAARRRGAWRQLFTRGNRQDARALEQYLQERYSGERAILTKNGRSALALALKAYLEPGDGVLVNGFTCYAVIEAVKAAGCVPVYVDINRGTLNFDAGTLPKALELDFSRRARSGPSGKTELPGSGNQTSSVSSRSVAQSLREEPRSLRSPLVAYGREKSNSSVQRPKCIIIQNTLSIPVNIAEIERFAAKHNLIIIEDLAHSVGVKYPDGREAGTVGAATVLSFGKDKAVDTISGGALVLRQPCKHPIEAPEKLPKKADVLRARWYPLFAALVRGLARVHLGGALMRLLVRMHFVEKSADSRLSLTERPPDFEAKLALEQLKSGAEGVGREFCLVRDRDKVLKELKAAGYHFDGFWYERPVSPERYYKKVHFPEENCPVAAGVAEEIINIPTYYKKSELAGARRIIKPYLIREEDE